MNQVTKSNQIHLYIGALNSACFSHLQISKILKFIFARKHNWKDQIGQARHRGLLDKYRFRKRNESPVNPFVKH